MGAERREQARRDLDLARLAILAGFEAPAAA